MENLIAAVTTAILSLVPQWKSERNLARAEEYATIIVEESQAVEPPIDPFLIVAIVFKESSFRPAIMGKKGEVGLMQIMPRGAVTRVVRTSKEKLTTARANIRVGIGHLRFWQEKCGIEDEDVWISAYNRGRCRRTEYAKRVKRFYCRIKPGGCAGGVS